MTPNTDPAEQLVEIVCKALGTSLRHYMPTTKRSAIEAAGGWITAQNRQTDALLQRAEALASTAPTLDWNEDRNIMAAVHLAGDLRTANNVRRAA